MYIIAAHFDTAIHTFGPFFTEGEANAAIESLGPPVFAQDDYYYLSVVKVERGSVRKWWSELNE